MNGKLEDELLEFLVLILLGILVRFAPRITKNRTVQSIILMAICVLSVLFLLKISADTGAVTVWSVYILFLLYAITLDSKIYALIFAASCIIFQIALWIRKPEVTVIIDANQYMTRIIVIGLSYFVARYLIVEYTSKLQGYRRFAREQETLEKISTNFISVNNENTDEKIDNLFELSAGILDFDQAYLVEFDADYENATFLHTHTTSETTESFPFYPGMKVKTTTLPMVKPLIAQNEPIICEDITNIYDDKEMEARNFFISRGVKSCFALPITIDKKIVEMLVVEYKTRLDANLAESRLNYLKIIANTLGDTRKKALYEERLYNIAYFDEATQLANKNMLIKRLEQKIHDNKGSEKIAVLDVELVNLRMIKDTFGQSIEEQVIINSAIIIKKLFGESCDVSRSGDGKLSILLQAAKNTEQIKTFAGKLLDSFSVPISTETGIEALFVVVYIGISVYPDDGRDAYELLKNADLAGYEARSNDEKIVFYTKHMENNVVETTLFTNKLFKSLQNEKFFLEFQPQISCETGKTVGVEALLRWDSNGGKKVLPDRFIPILEQTGLIYDVGLWVLKQALQEHNRLIKNGFPPLRFSVNLSIVQLKGGNFVLDFTKIIEESGVDPQYIELEITESFFFEDPEDTLKKLHKMKELGIHIAIDDFGSGYSSLNRLKLVPFDRIKIDKDIIDYIDLEAKAAPITELIISLAKTFNACITAEGVETKEQADFLRNVACDEIQGFYFSKPLSSEALEVFLRQEAM
ncbi:MAG: EAL domain-containing protein [Lachnospiraceae bacterium]